MDDIIEELTMEDPFQPDPITLHKPFSTSLTDCVINWKRKRKSTSVVSTVKLDDVSILNDLHLDSHHIYF